MSQLHVFGDSFASDWGYDFQWMHQLGKLLGCEKVHSSGQPGAANEWFLMMLAEVYAQKFIKPGDYVVVTLTAAGRQWLVERVPMIGNWANMRNVDPGYFGLTREETDSINSYYKHLHNPAVDAFRWDAYAAWCSVMCDTLLENNIRMITMQGFGHGTAISPRSCVPVTGSLYQLSEREFISATAMKEWYGRSVPDQRLNHLLKDNHTILAEKLCASLTDLTPLDLNLGFKSKRITATNDDHLKDQLSPVEMR